MAQESGKSDTATSKDTPTDGLHMHVKVYAPFKVYFDGQAQSVSAKNGTGPFDVLAQHHNFMTILETCDLIINIDENKEEKIPILKGVMHVKADEVVVFLDV